MVTGNDMLMGRNHRVALLLALALSFSLRIAAEFDLGGLFLPLYVLAFGVMCFYSPPIAGSYLLFGYVYFPLMDQLPFGALPRLPATSIMMAAIIAGLLMARMLKGRVRVLLAPAVISYAIIFAIIFALGYWGIVRSGNWGNNLVRILAWSKIEACVPMFLVGLLCCWSLADLRVIVYSLPVWFLLYIAYIPVSNYSAFFAALPGSADVYSIGLGYGSLNVNTLGQCACIAAVTAFALWLHRSGRSSVTVYFWLFLISSLIVLATAARQALLGLLIGLLVAVYRWKPAWSVVFCACLAVGGIVIGGSMQDLEEDHGYAARLGDLARSPEEWKTGSVSVRWLEIKSAFEHIPQSPFVGFGFGGYGLRENPPDINSVDDLNDQIFLQRLSNDGYYLVGEHNFPVALMMQTGIVGVACFASLIVGPCLWFRRRLRLLPADARQCCRPINVALTSAGAAFLLMLNISGGFSLGSMSMFLFFIGVLIACCASFSVKSRFMSEQPCA